MDKLIYACEWGKDREKSWSGTHLNLFKALSKYFDIIDFDMNGDTLVDLFCKLLSRRDMSLLKNKLNTHKFFDKFKDNIEPVLQFSESPALKSGKSFIYQDLSVSTLKDIRENNPDLYKSSGFGKFSKRVLSKREKRQTDYYLSNNCAAIFTMGKWLARDLVERGNVPDDKVYHVGGGINTDPSLVDYSRKEGKRILFIGRDFERKNGPLVVEAFKLLYQENNNYELYIAGPDKLDISFPNPYFRGH